VAEDENKLQVSYNLAGDFAKSISGLLRLCRNSYVKGDIGEWFWYLSSIQENIFMLVSTDGQELLDSLFDKCQTNYPNWIKFKQLKLIDNEVGREMLLKKNVFSKDCKIYARAVMNELNELGFFPSKEQLSEVKLE
jgi:hypothetical protein